MKKEINVGIIVAIVEAIFALIVGYLLYLVQENTIEQKTVETLAGYFDEVEADMSYEQAMKQLIEDSLQKDVLINDLRQKEQELIEIKASLEIDENNSKIVESAQHYASTNDYEMALAVLRSVVSKTPQMQAMISDYEKQYELEILNAVDVLVIEGSYDEAINLLNEALQVIPNSTSLAQKVGNVNNSKPQIFMNILQPYEKRGYSEKSSGYFMEMGRVKYTNGFQLGTSLEKSYAIFNLNGQYSKISGIIGHVDGSGANDKVVLISCDGLLVATIEIGALDLPKEFTIDVTGIKQLKFERSSGTTQTGFAEMTIQ